MPKRANKIAPVFLSHLRGIAGRSSLFNRPDVPGPAHPLRDLRGCLLYLVPPAPGDTRLQVVFGPQSVAFLALECASPLAAFSLRASMPPLQTGSGFSVSLLHHCSVSVRPLRLAKVDVFTGDVFELRLARARQLDGQFLRFESRVVTVTLA